MHGVPDYIRSDNGSEFTARLVREWLKRLKVKTLFPVFIFIYYWYYEYNLMLQHMCCNICVAFHTFATYYRTCFSLKVMNDFWITKMSRWKPLHLRGFFILPTLLVEIITGNPSSHTQDDGKVYGLLSQPYIVSCWNRFG